MADYVLKIPHKHMTNWIIFLIRSDFGYKTPHVIFARSETTEMRYFGSLTITARDFTIAPCKSRRPRVLRAGDVDN